MTRPPLIFGHRGAKAHVVENTLPSFARALADGADGVELDVRTTRDGEVVVLHDPDLARLTGGRDARRAQDLDARDLEAVELSGPEGPARAPRLAEVLEWAEAQRCLLNVELKHDTHDPGALVRGLRTLWARHPRAASRVLFSSFDPGLLARVALALPGTPRALLIHEGQRVAKTPIASIVARGLGAGASHPERTLCSPERIAGWRRAGLRVNVWTVNDPGEARDLAALGVDGIITDDPALVRAALG